MHWRVIAVTCLAVTAGCGSLATGTEPTPTVTPSPPPDVQTSTSTPSGLAPGLGGGGVTNADRLAAAHLASLEGPSYAWVAERRVDRLSDRTGDEHLVRQELVVESDRRYRFETNRRDVHSRGDERFRGDVSEFADGETVSSRFVPFGDRAFTYDTEHAAPATDAYARELTLPVRQYLAVPNATVAAARMDGQPYYRLESHGREFPGATTGQNVSVSALIAPSGFVQSMNVTYEVDRGSRVEHVRYWFEFDRTDDVTVERPDWIRERWSGD